MYYHAVQIRVSHRMIDDFACDVMVAKDRLRADVTKADLVKEICVEDSKTSRSMCEDLLGYSHEQAK